MKHRLAATIILMVAMFMDLVDSTITNVALPAIGADLGANPAQLEWTLAGYVVAFATLLITGGRLGDIFGRRRVFVIGAAGFTLASLVASWAVTGDMLVATRVLQGAFAGIMVPQVLSSVQVMFAPHERGPVFGIIGALSALGAVSGLLIGGSLVTADVAGLGWRSIFLVNVPVGILLIIAAVLVVPNSKSEHPLKLDPLGVLLGAATVFLVVFPLTDGRQAGWPWWIWAMLAAAPFVLALFVRQQRRKLAADGSALLPLALFRDRGFSSGLAVQVVSSVGNGSYALILIFYVQQALGFTPLAAGLTILPIAVGSMLATPLAMFTSKKLGRTAVLVGGIVQAAAFAWTMLLVRSLGEGLSGWHLVAPLTLAGVGMMILIMPQMESTLATVPTESAGAASGTLTTLGQVGMVLGVALAGAVYFGILADGGAPIGGVTAGLWVTVGAYVLAGGLALTMPKVRARDVVLAA
jgi:EmrB/QacA subfamily drug resistance transporter